MLGDVILIVFLVLIMALLLSSITRGAPYVPTHHDAVEKVVGVCGVKAGEKVLDLGSGDGRIVMAFARRSIEAHGYEINPILVFISRSKIKKDNLQGKAFIHWKSFWKADFSDFDIITLFGITQIMPRLEQKLLSELRAGAKVVSYVFKFPNWQPVKKEGAIYLYEKN